MPIGVVSKTDFEKEMASLGLLRNEEDLISTPVIIPEVLEKDAEFKEETENEEREARALCVREIELTHGRGHVNEVPNSIRQFIAGEAIAGANQKQLAKEFGVSTSSVSAYKNGATSTASYNKPNQELKSANDSLKEELASNSLAKLRAALEAITPAKLLESKVTDAAVVARAMASVHKDLLPSETSEARFNQVIIFKPRMREEDDYEVIDIQQQEA